MILFWSLAAVMVAAALAFVLLPLLRGGTDAGVDQQKLNVAVHRDRLAELDKEHAEGSMNEEQYAQAKEELERDLLQDISGAAPKAAIPILPIGTGGLG